MAASAYYRSVALLVVTAVAGCTEIYSPSAPDRNWTSVETARFTLLVRPGSFCKSAAPILGESLEDQYDNALSVLGLAASGRITLFLYNSPSEASPPLGSDRSGVAFPETGAVHATCVPPLNDGLKSLLNHEINHVIVNRALGRAGTYFMNEGLASALVSDHIAPIGPTYLFAWAASNRNLLIPITTLVDDDRWQASPEQAAYNTGASFLAWLIQQHGRDRLKQIYQARSSEIAQRVSAVYGKRLEALEADWLAFVGSRRAGLPTKN